MTWPAGSEWERPGAGGGGGGGTPARVDPDSYDILVWHDWDGTLPWASSGTNALELDAKVGDVLRGMGTFGGGVPAPYPLSYASGGGLLRSPASSNVGESQTMTASGWVWIPQLPDSAVLCGLFLKRDTEGAWDSPYSPWGFYVSENGSLVVAVRLDDGSDTQVVLQSDAGSMPAGLHHVGFTLDDQVLTAYLDGQVAEGTVPTDLGHDIAFYGHGPYLLGGFLNNTTAFYSGGWADDVRVASVVRASSWFADVWASRRTT